MSKCEHVWAFSIYFPHVYCLNRKCTKAIGVKEAERRLNEYPALKRKNKAKQDAIDNALVAHRRCSATSIPDKTDAVIVWSIAWQEIEDALLTAEEQE